MVRKVAVTLAGSLVLGLTACGRDSPRRPPAEDAPAAQAPAVPAAAPAEARPTPPAPRGDMDERMGVVPLPDGRPFQSTLYDLTVVGQLQSARKLPYYIMTGRGCIDCDVNLAVYIHSPSDGEMGIQGEQRRFKYPGREVFYEDSTLLYEARMFYGNCAASHPNAAIWLQRQPDAFGKWHANALVAQVTQDTLVVTTLESNPPTLAEVQAAVRRGSCRELPGINRASEP